MGLIFFFLDRSWAVCHSKSGRVSAPLCCRFPMLLSYSLVLGTVYAELNSWTVE